MWFETYRLEIFHSKCQPGAMGGHCFAHLDQDVSMALPYLNTVIRGSNISKILQASHSKLRENQSPFMAMKLPSMR